MIIATMATLSSRVELLEKTIASLAPQVDAICVYLNGHEQVPKFLHQPKVLHAILSSEAGWRGGEAKLWFWDDEEFRAAPRWQLDDVALVVDDDIVYPPDYAARKVECLDRHPGSVACVCGSILKDPIEDYATSRYVARTVGRLDADARVHLPGAGTMAFRVRDLRISLREDFRWSHCVDLHVGMICKRQGVEVWSVARPDQWLRPMSIPMNGTNTFRARVGAGNASVETALARGALPWPKLPVDVGGIAERTGVPTAPAPREDRTRARLERLNTARERGRHGSH